MVLSSSANISLTAINMEETKAINRGKSALPTNRTGMRPFEKSLKGILEDPRIKLEQQARDRAKKKKQEI